MMFKRDKKKLETKQTLVKLQHRHKTCFLVSCAVQGAEAL